MEALRDDCAARGCELSVELEVESGLVEGEAESAVVEAEREAVAIETTAVRQEALDVGDEGKWWDAESEARCHDWEGYWDE